MRVRPKLEPLLPRKHLAWWWVCSFWLCVLVHVSNWAHFALETHEVCQQHGELSHASHGSIERHDVDSDVGGSDVASSEPAFVSGSGASDGVTHVEPGEAPEAHSHCCPPTDRVAPTELPARFAEVRQLDDDRQSMWVVSSSASERARYRLAPKTSPPA